MNWPEEDLRLKEYERSRSGKCRTWEGRWATVELQIAYDTGVFDGACVLKGLLDWAEAIRARGDLPAIDCSACGAEPGEHCRPECHANAEPDRCECCGYDDLEFFVIHDERWCQNCAYQHSCGDFACACTDEELRMRPAKDNR